ncbi:hypothetical protein F0562_026208 [Nyssa sinensis]|uniref:Uncharacterized protein n=1 Tax=Nyssa sinensis TaxID=561372 RepID=A0A5J5BAU8_9ASTE|nr:hypothetical protein F0562_026208 [Nyssa sinensis]
MTSTHNGENSGAIEESNGSNRVKGHIPLHISTSQRGLINDENPQDRFHDNLSALPKRTRFFKFGSLASPSAKFHRIAEERDVFSRTVPSSTSHALRERFNRVFSRKIDWVSLSKICKEWIRDPMNMALLFWIVCVAVSGAILFLVMTGMLNAALPKKSQRDAWFEVLEYVSLLRLLHLQLPGVYTIISPLGKEYDSELDEEAQVQITAAESSRPSQLRSKSLQKRYSFASRDDGTIVESRPKWSGGVLDIWDDISLAYLSLFCSFCVFGWNMERLGFGNMKCGLGIYIMLWKINFAENKGMNVASFQFHLCPVKMENSNLDQAQVLPLEKSPSPSQIVKVNSPSPSEVSKGYFSPDRQLPSVEEEPRTRGLSLIAATLCKNDANGYVCLKFTPPNILLNQIAIPGRPGGGGENCYSNLGPSGQKATGGN